MAVRADHRALAICGLAKGETARAKPYMTVVLFWELSTLMVGLSFAPSVAVLAYDDIFKPGG